MINHSQELHTAIKAVKEGSKIALEYFQTQIEVKTKKDNSFVTIADVETENAIKKTILATYPQAKFLAEESGGDMLADDFWIIDPIDGTRVFVKGIPQWSILIAHYRHKEITTGVCYNPTQQLMLIAEKGKGAFLNGKKVSVSKTKSAHGSFGSFGSFHRFKNIEPILKLNQANVIFRSYEHAYAFTFLASGKMDVIIDGYATPWDYAPFIRIIEEAGGKTTDFEGKPWDFQSESLLATNGIIHDEILEIINKK